MSFNISALVIGAIPATVTAIIVWIAVRYFRRVVERLEGRRNGHSKDSKTLATLRIVKKGDGIDIVVEQEQGGK